MKRKRMGSASALEGWVGGGKVKELDSRRGRRRGGRLKARSRGGRGGQGAPGLDPGVVWMGV